MTHSLHRRGTVKNLKDDYVVLITPAVGVNHEGSKDKLKKILHKIFELGPNNIGSYETGTMYTGATLDEIKEKLSETPRVRCCFDDREKVNELIRFLKNSEFGLSVTISGLIDNIIQMANEEEVRPHSVNLSLGVFGKAEYLPLEGVLEFVTMCGHGMISRYLVEKVIKDVRNSKLSIENAVEVMARPCVCGIFNTERARQLLDKSVR